MSSVFNNFMGGLTFGLLTSNPFFGGMGGFGYGCGCGFGGVGGFIFGGMYNAVNLTGFANPFPSIFPYYMGGGGYSSTAGLIMPQSFTNSFPTIDFAGPCKSLWDTYTNPDSEYNKQMRDWFQRMNSLQNPFASIYDKSDKEENTAKNDVDKASDKADSTNKSQTSATNTSAKRTTNTVSKSSVKIVSAKNNDNTKREFAEVYKSLGITDTRFQKMFEECVLSINEGRKRGKDFNMFDVKAMNKNGVLQPTYDEYRTKIKHLPARDVKNMTMEEMCDIYYTMFYVKGGAKDIKDDRLALYVFDSDVNMGVGTGKTLLERSGNDAEKFEAERREEYKRRKGYDKYKDAWNNRIANTKKYADNNFSAVA